MGKRKKQNGGLGNGDPVGLETADIEPGKLEETLEEKKSSGLLLFAVKENAGSVVDFLLNQDPDREPSLTPAMICEALSEAIKLGFVDIIALLFQKIQGTKFFTFPEKTSLGDFWIRYLEKYALSDNERDLVSELHAIFRTVELPRRCDPEQNQPDLFAPWKARNFLISKLHAHSDDIFSEEFRKALQDVAGWLQQFSQDKPLPERYFGKGSSLIKIFFPSANQVEEKSLEVESLGKEVALK